MSNDNRPLLADLKREIGSLGVDLRESVELRWRLAQLELESDIRLAKRLAVVLVIVLMMVLTALPVLAVCLAQVCDGWLGISDTGWLAIFGFALLFGGAAGGYAAYRRFRRSFLGFEQTFEELREDLVWLEEWTKSREKETTAKPGIEDAIARAGEQESKRAGEKEGN